MGLMRTENLSNLSGILSEEVDLMYLGLEAMVRVLGLKKRSLLWILCLRLMIDFLVA
jgi:hypothetical protein